MTRFLAWAGALTVGAAVGYLTAVYIRETRKAHADAARWAAHRAQPYVTDFQMSAGVEEFLDATRKAAEVAEYAEYACCRAGVVNYPDPCPWHAESASQEAGEGL